MKGYSVVGKTTDGLTVMKGLFRLVNQEGMSITEMLYACEAFKIMPDWIDFCRDAIRCQWSPATILCRLGPALEDVYGHVFRKQVTDTLGRMMMVEVE